MKGLQDSDRHINDDKLDNVIIGLFIFTKILWEKDIFGIIRIK